ncbi:MAG: hypothetical protein K2X87_32810 [Gemmataceae bacterium]|nr:hypothetical protein [Gemmataceae bacterium]
MDEGLAGRIAALVDARRAGTQGSDWERALAARFGGLAVYGDIGGSLVVRPDGSVLCVGHDDGRAEDAGPGWRTLALAAAGDHFPELAALIPGRPRPPPRAGGVAGAGAGTASAGGGCRRTSVETQASWHPATPR